MELVTLVVGLLLFVIAVSGNGLLIFLVVRRRSLRTTNNSFVLSLALADFCCGLVYASALLSQQFNPASFIVLGRCMRYLLHVSVTNLCALTLDRYLAIVNPLRYVALMTTRRIFFLLTLAWGVPVVIYLAPSLALKFGTSGEYKIPFVTSLCVIQICVCVLLLLATTRIFLIVRRHARRNVVVVKQLMFNHTLQHGRAFRPQEAASAKVVGSVVGIFIICYAVNIYNNICLVELCTAPKAFKVYNVTLLLKVVNSVVNPFAYAFFKKDVKKELKRFLSSSLHRAAVIPMHLRTKGVREEGISLVGQAWSVDGNFIEINQEDAEVAC